MAHSGWNTDEVLSFKMWNNNTVVTRNDTYASRSGKCRHWQNEQKLNLTISLIQLFINHKSFGRYNLHVWKKNHWSFKSGTIIQWSLRMTHTVNPLLSPQGAYFFKHFWGGGLNRGGGLFNLVTYITCSKNTMVWDRVDLRVVQLKSLSHVFNSLVGEKSNKNKMLIFFKNVLLASCCSVIFMRMVTCIDLWYTSY